MYIPGTKYLYDLHVRVYMYTILFGYDIVATSCMILFLSLSSPQYAKDTQHEKIQRGLALGLSMVSECISDLNFTCHVYTCILSLHMHTCHPHTITVFYTVS